MPSAQFSCLAFFNVTEKHVVCFQSIISLFTQDNFFKFILLLSELEVFFIASI